MVLVVVDGGGRHGSLEGRLGREMGEVRVWLKEIENGRDDGRETDDDWVLKGTVRWKKLMPGVEVTDSNQTRCPHRWVKMSMDVSKDTFSSCYLRWFK